MLNMNLTSFSDDLERFKDASDLYAYYRGFGLDGIELMPGQPIDGTCITPDMINGVHMLCIADWIDMDREKLISHYRENLEFAKAVHAKYVVFHIAQMTDMEALTLQFKRSDEEVVEKAAGLINSLMNGSDYQFDFLMENLWYPGLTFVRPEIASYLIDAVDYPGKGFMLDTGHLLHMNYDLCSQEEGIDYIQELLDRNESVIPYIKGFHLQQSITGEYVKNFIASHKTFPDDPDAFNELLFRHLFAVDRHLPFTTPRVNELIRRVKPRYITFEYITESRAQHEEYMKAGTAALDRSLFPRCSAPEYPAF